MRHLCDVKNVSCRLSRTPNDRPPSERSSTHLGGHLRRVSIGLLLPLLNLDIIALPLSDVELTRAPDLDSILLQHELAPVGQPADYARDGEEDGEVVGWETEGLVDEAGPV
jgi:hypothetical protein